MKLKHSGLVTEDVQRLTRFYERITGAKAAILNRGYVEFQHSPCAGLAITATSPTRAYGEGVCSHPAAIARWSLISRWRMSTRTTHA